MPYSWITAPFTYFVQDYFLRHQTSKNDLKHGTGVSICRNTSALIFSTKSADIHEKYKLETLLPDTTLYTGTSMERRHQNLHGLFTFIRQNFKLDSSVSHAHRMPVFSHCKLEECMVGAEGIHSKSRHILNEVRPEFWYGYATSI